jgi:hypothetical protein
MRISFPIFPWFQSHWTRIFVHEEFFASPWRLYAPGHDWDDWCGHSPLSSQATILYNPSTRSWLIQVLRVFVKWTIFSFVLRSSLVGKRNTANMWSYVSLWNPVFLCHAGPHSPHCHVSSLSMAPRRPKRRKNPTIEDAEQSKGVPYIEMLMHHQHEWCQVLTTRYCSWHRNSSHSRPFYTRSMF